MTSEYNDPFKPSIHYGVKHIISPNSGNDDLYSAPILPQRGENQGATSQWSSGGGRLGWGGRQGQHDTVEDGYGWGKVGQSYSGGAWRTVPQRRRKRMKYPRAESLSENDLVSLEEPYPEEHRQHGTNQPHIEAGATQGTTGRPVERRGSASPQSHSRHPRRSTPPMQWYRQRSRSRSPRSRSRSPDRRRVPESQRSRLTLPAETPIHRSRSRSSRGRQSSRGRDTLPEINPGPRLESRSSSRPRISTPESTRNRMSPHADATDCDETHGAVADYIPARRTHHHIQIDTTDSEKNHSAVSNSIPHPRWAAETESWSVTAIPNLANNIEHVAMETAADLSRVGTQTYIKAFVLDTLPRQFYTFTLLRLPHMYYSRVTRIFEDAELSMPQIKQGIVENFVKSKGPALPSAWMMELPSENIAYTTLTKTWEGFIDSVLREWKTLNIISVLLLSAILTMLQLEGAGTDPLIRFTALLSMICALMSLLFGCMFIIRFGTMRKTYKAAEWANEAKKSRTGIFWNVWVLLAMPATWLAWSMILYIVCIMSFVWRTGTISDGTRGEFTTQQALAGRISITVVLTFGLLYFFLIVATLQRYGDAMDRAWQQRISGWITDQNPVRSQTPNWGLNDPTQVQARSAGHTWNTWNTWGPSSPPQPNYDQEYNHQPSPPRSGLFGPRTVSEISQSDASPPIPSLADYIPDDAKNQSFVDVHLPPEVLMRSGPNPYSEEFERAKIRANLIYMTRVVTLNDANTDGGSPVNPPVPMLRSDEGTQSVPVDSAPETSYNVVPDESVLSASPLLGIKYVLADSQPENSGWVELKKEVMSSWNSEDHSSLQGALDKWNTSKLLDKNCQVALCKEFRVGGVELYAVYSFSSSRPLPNLDTGSFVLPPNLSALEIFAFKTNPLWKDPSYPVTIKIGDHQRWADFAKIKG